MKQEAFLNISFELQLIKSKALDISSATARVAPDLLKAFVIEKIEKKKNKVGI